MYTLPLELWPEIARDPATARPLSSTCKYAAAALRGVFTCDETGDYPITIYKMNGRHFSATARVMPECMTTAETFMINGNIYSEFTHIRGRYILAADSRGHRTNLKLGHKYVMVENGDGTVFTVMRRDLAELCVFRHILGIRRAYEVTDTYFSGTGIKLSEIPREQNGRTTILDIECERLEIIHTNTAPGKIHGDMVILAEIPLNDFCGASRATNTRCGGVTFAEQIRQRHPVTRRDATTVTRKKTEVGADNRNMNPKFVSYTAPNGSLYTFAFAHDGSDQVLHTANTRSGQTWEYEEIIIPIYAAVSEMTRLSSIPAVVVDCQIE